MSDQEEATRYFRRSFRTSPTVYRNFKPLMSAELEKSRTDAAAECAKALFRLDPENPRVMQDILDIYGSDRYDGALRELVWELMKEHEANREAAVNIGFHYGMRLVATGNHRSAVQTLRGANEAALSISGDHPALAGIGELLAEIGERGKSTDLPTNLGPTPE